MGRPAAGVFWLFGGRILLGSMVWFWVGFVSRRWNWLVDLVEDIDLMKSQRSCSYVGTFNAHRLGCNMCILHIEPRTHAHWIGCVCCCNDRAGINSRERQCQKGTLSTSLVPQYK
ncbi:hypothetical protein B0H11DRAFT_2046612 [Mycena galericulata]|nr:hypothetical protein B0H11DRAFT_2046612 [Mycena galericulata]